MSKRLRPDPIELEALVRAAAFQLLFTRVEAVAPELLAEATGISSHKLAALLDHLDQAGRIRRDGGGRVVGSAGLSVIPDRHEIEVDGRRFWTWCAYDILGIFGAMGSNGRAWSPSPPDGKPIELHFTRGRPDKNEAALFRPDEELMRSCENVYEEWCPNSNLFASKELATQWADRNSMRGRVLDLDEAADLATDAWSDVI